MIPPAPDEDFCYVTTTGRRTGRAHRIEIWYALEGGTIYIMSGRGADWVRNAAAEPSLEVEIAGMIHPATYRPARPGTEGSRARRLLAAKYQGWKEGEPLSSWASSAFVVALDLAES